MELEAIGRADTVDGAPPLLKRATDELRRVVVALEALIGESDGRCAPLILPAVPWC